MGIKDKMMDRYLDKMTKEEKLEMMDSMMDRFLEDFTPEERQDMMVRMMPKMMEGIDTSQMMPMMMAQMMGGMMGGGEMTSPDPVEGQEGVPMVNGFSPPNMCKRMVEGMADMVETNRAILEELRKRPDHVHTIG